MCTRKVLWEGVITIYEGQRGSGLERGHVALTINTFKKICSIFIDGPESGRVMRFGEHQPCNASMNFTHG